MLAAPVAALVAALHAGAAHAVPAPPVQSHPAPATVVVLSARQRPSQHPTAPADRHPRAWCFLGTAADDCNGAGPMWSCPDSTLWPDAHVACHVPWGSPRKSR